MMPNADAVMPAGPTSPAVPAVTGDAAVGSLPVHLAEMLAALIRIADLQMQIGLARVTSTLLRIALFIMVCVCSVALALVAVIFLDTGVYRILTDLLMIRAPWSLLIFAGAHFLMAGMLAAIAVKILSKRSGPKSHGGGAS